MPKVRSFGITKSITPMPAHLLDRKISFSGYVSQSDKLVADLHLYKDQNWALINQDSPFVASYSGHIVWLTGCILEYAQEIQGKGGDPSLFAKTMLRTVIATYMHQGFHSYQEMMTMLHDPVVIKDFSDLGITFTEEELNCIDHKSVSQALLEAADYNKTALLKRASLSRIKNEVNLKQIEKPEEKDVRATYLPVQKVEAGNVFYNKDSGFDKHKKEEVVTLFLHKMKLAIIENESVLLNEVAKQLFKMAGTKRNIFNFFGERYSTKTKSCESLIKILLEPQNAYVLMALDIHEGEASDMRAQLEKKMMLAFADDDVVTPDSGSDDSFKTEP